MPTKSKSPYLPFGDYKMAPWYGKDIPLGQTIQPGRPGIRLRRGPRDAGHGRAGRHVRSAQGQDPGQPVL